MLNTVIERVVSEKSYLMGTDFDSVKSECLFYKDYSDYTAFLAENLRVYGGTLNYRYTMPEYIIREADRVEAVEVVQDKDTEENLVIKELKDKYFKRILSRFKKDSLKLTDWESLQIFLKKENAVLDLTKGSHSAVHIIVWYILKFVCDDLQISDYRTFNKWFTTNSYDLAGFVRDIMYAYNSRKSKYYNGTFLGSEPFEQVLCLKYLSSTTFLMLFKEFNKRVIINVKKVKDTDYKRIKTVWEYEVKKDMLFTDYTLVKESVKVTDVSFEEIIQHFDLESNKDKARIQLFIKGLYDYACTHGFTYEAFCYLLYINRYDIPIIILGKQGNKIAVTQDINLSVGHLISGSQLSFYIAKTVPSVTVSTLSRDEEFIVLLIDDKIFDIDVFRLTGLRGRFKDFEIEKSSIFVKRFDDKLDSIGYAPLNVYLAKELTWKYGILYLQKVIQLEDELDFDNCEEVYHNIQDLFISWCYLEYMLIDPIYHDNGYDRLPLKFKCKNHYEPIFSKYFSSVLKDSNGANFATFSDYICRQFVVGQIGKYVDDNITLHYGNVKMILNKFKRRFAREIYIAGYTIMLVDSKIRTVYSDEEMKDREYFTDKFNLSKHFDDLEVYKEMSGVTDEDDIIKTTISFADYLLYNAQVLKSGIMLQNAG